MNRTDQTSQPLELTPVVWIALAVVVLLGLARLTKDRDPVQTLDFLDRSNPIIVRSQSAHRFPSLGITITPPDGWSYLSLTDDVVATQPTFVNESSDLIVRIHQPWNGDWPQANVVEYRYAESTVEWVDMNRSRVTITFTGPGTLRLAYAWDQLDHRSVGRLTRGDAEITIIATPRVKKSARRESLDGFCAAVEFIKASE